MNKYFDSQFLLSTNIMKKYITKLFFESMKLICFCLAFIFIFLLNSNIVYAAKYTITNGLDFNNRIKMSINSEYKSYTPEYTIKKVMWSQNFSNDEVNLIDISEDGDSSVLAYIKNATLYIVSDDDIYLNANASYMFDKFVGLETVDLSFVNFSKTRNMDFMFGNDRFLKKINLDNDETIKLSSMKGMFYDCQSLTDLDIFMLDTRNVTNMYALFCNCKNLKNINIDTTKWSIRNVSNYNDMFLACFSLKTNKGTFAININNVDYKKYAVAGSDNVEGLLKDFDYEYDDYGKRDPFLPVDTIGSVLLYDRENINNDSYITVDFVNNSKKLSELNIATDSSLNQNYSGASIKKGRLTLSKNLLKETVKELPLDKLEEYADPNVPILKSETTSVSVMRRATKAWEKNATNSNANEIAPMEIINEALKSTNSDISSIKGILRPDYSSLNVDEIEDATSQDTKINDAISEKDVNDIKNAERVNGPSESIFSNININGLSTVLIIIIFMLVGAIIFKNKNR